MQLVLIRSRSNTLQQRLGGQGYLGRRSVADSVESAEMLVRESRDVHMLLRTLDPTENFPPYARFHGDGRKVFRKRTHIS